MKYKVCRKTGRDKIIESDFVQVEEGVFTFFDRRQAMTPKAVIPVEQIKFVEAGD